MTIDPKAASTSWNRIFFNLAGKTNVQENNLHEVMFFFKINLKPNSSKAAAYFRPEAGALETIFASSIAFLFVRHPFERIVSAFRFLIVL